MFVVGAVVAFAVLLSIQWTSNQRVSDRLTRIEQQELQKMISTSWTHQGRTVTVTSKWKEHSSTESYADFLLRHDREVDAALVQFPQDPP